MIVSDLLRSDIDSLIAISDEVFGPGYINSDSFDNHTNLVIRHDDQIAGFGICYKIGCGEKNTLPGFCLDLPDQMKDVLRSNELGLIKTVAVSAKKQGKGLGEILFKSLENRLIDQGCKIIIVPAWTVNGVIFIESILNKNNYNKYFTVSKMWKDICNNSYSCPYYVDFCVCDAVYYVKFIDN